MILNSLLFVLELQESNLTETIIQYSYENFPKIIIKYHFFYLTLIQ